MTNPALPPERLRSLRAEIERHPTSLIMESAHVRVLLDTADRCAEMEKALAESKAKESTEVIFDLDDAKNEIAALKAKLAEVTGAAPFIEGSNWSRKICEKEMEALKHERDKHSEMREYEHAERYNALGQVRDLQAQLAECEKERDDAVKWRDFHDIQAQRIMIARDNALNEVKAIRAQLAQLAQSAEACARMRDSEYRLSSCAKTLNDIAEWIDQQRLQLPIDQDARLAGWRNTLQALSPPQPNQGKP